MPKTAAESQAQILEKLNKNTYLTTFMKSRKNLDGTPMNSLDVIKRIQNTLVSYPKSQSAAALNASLNKISDFITKLDENSKVANDKIGMAWMNDYLDCFKTFNSQVTDFYNENGFKLADKPEMQALKGITQVVDCAFSNLAQKNRSEDLDTVDFAKDAYINYYNDLEVAGIDFIENCQKYEKLFKVGELHFDNLDKMADEKKSELGRNENRYKEFAEKFFLIPGSKKQYEEYGELCEKLGDIRDKIDSLNKKYLTNKNTETNMNNYILKIKDVDKEIYSKKNNITKDKAELVKVNQRLKSFKSEKEKVDKQLEKFDSEAMEKMQAEYKSNDAGIKRIGEALTALRSLHETRLGEKKINIARIMEQKEYTPKAYHYGLESNDYYALQTYEKALSDLKELAGNNFPKEINDRLEKGEIIEPIDLYRKVREGAKTAQQHLNKNQKTYKKRLSEYNQLQLSSNTLSHNISNDKKNEKRLSKSIKLANSEIEKLENRKKGFMGLAMEASNKITGTKFETNNTMLLGLHTKKFLNDDLKEINASKDQEKKIVEQMQNYPDMSPSITRATWVLYGNVKGAQNELRYIETMQNKKNELQQKYDENIESLEKSQKDFSYLKNTTYESISNKLQGILDHIHDKTSDPNNAKRDAQGKNSDDFYNMYTRLANTITELNNPQKTKEEKAKMITDLADSAEHYLKVKEKQFRPFPTEQRRARIAFAQEICDLKETALDMIKNTDEREKTLHEFFKPVDKSKTLDSVLKVYEAKATSKAMQVEAGSSVREAKSDTVEIHRSAL